MEKGKNKVFWFDVETTGLDPANNGIIELSCCIEINGNIVDKANYNIKPFDKDIIEHDALEITGTTLEDIENYRKPESVYRDLRALLSKYVDKYDKKDKFMIGGYNVTFDMYFLKYFFKKNNDDFFGSFFNYKLIDPLYLIRIMDYANKIPYVKNHKLSTMCDAFGIEINAHSSMSDVEATIELLNRLLSYLRIYGDSNEI